MKVRLKESNVSRIKLHFGVYTTSRYQRKVRKRVLNWSQRLDQLGVLPRSGSLVILYSSVGCTFVECLLCNVLCVCNTLHEPHVHIQSFLSYVSVLHQEGAGSELLLANFTDG